MDSTRQSTPSVRWIIAALFVALGALVAACSDDETGARTGDVASEPDLSGEVDAIDEVEEPGADVVEVGPDTNEDAADEPDVAVQTSAIDPDRMFEDVRWLAADERAGREPGTPGNEAALDYVEALFEELDLVPAGDEEGSYRQAFEFELWRGSDTADVAIDGTDLEAGSAFFELWYSGAGEVSAELVFAGYGLTIPPFDAAEYPDCPVPAETGYDDFAGVDVTDAIALVLRRGPDGDEDVHEQCPASEVCVEPPCLWNFGYKAANARAHGAAAMVVVQDFAQGPGLPDGASIGIEYFDEAFPAVFVERTSVTAAVPDLETWAEAIDFSFTPASTATGVNASISLDAAVETVASENLLGAIEGTDPELADEVIVIGAHVDHLGTDPATGDIYNGADDNASGTAVMMELARAMSLSGIEPARTVLFASWNAEEEGLIGSCYYVDNPVYPLESTIAVFSIDMVGQGNGTGLYLYGAQEAEIRWIAELMDGAQQQAGLDYRAMSMPALPLSDHACFWERGVPAVLAETAGLHENYHTPYDTIDGIDAAELEIAAAMIWAFLEVLAFGDEATFLD